jgi:hypothetical protein
VSDLDPRVCVPSPSRFDRAALRWSLALLWIGSGAVSLFNDAAGRALLFALPRQMADMLILAGAACDLILGMAMFVDRTLIRVCYAQIAVIAVYTVLATILVPELWLDPLMPLAKNGPIVVATLILARLSR